MVFIVTLIVASGVAAVVGLTQRDNSASTAQTPAAGGADFNGTYRADYGPGTDLEHKPSPECTCDDEQLGRPLDVWCQRVRGDGGEHQ